MKWFNNIFPKQPPEATTSQQEEELPVIVHPTECSEPTRKDLSKQSLATLKQFVPLRNISDQDVSLLPHVTLHFATDSVVFIYGQQANSVYYLLSGTLELQPHSKKSYEVSAGTIRANLPLNSGRFCGATAIAKTDVVILTATIELLQVWANKSKEEVSCVELVDVKLPEQIHGQRFFNSFITAYHENKLNVPSLPTVALKLKEAMKDEIGVREAVDIIQLDPPIVTRLIQVANSPLYAPTSPITNCQDAVTRLGLDATKSLVLGISIKQLFHCDDKTLMKGMRKVWQDSLYISSLSFILAQQSRTVSPEDALLAGLITEIGVIPLIHFAEQYPEEYPDFSELEQAIPYLRGPVGMLVLHTLGFSEVLTHIPHHAENWFYESGSDQLDLTDIVILAKLHSYFGSQKAKNLPYINSIPAYSKLRQGELDTDFSLNVLQQAKQRVQAAMRAFS